MTPVAVKILGYQEPLFSRLEPIFNYLPPDVANDVALALEDIFNAHLKLKNDLEETWKESREYEEKFIEADECAKSLGDTVEAWRDAYEEEQEKVKNLNAELKQLSEAVIKAGEEVEI